jgi:hypothetical protein
MDEGEYAELLRYLLASVEGSELRDAQGSVYEAGLEARSGRDQLSASLRALRTQIELAGEGVADDVLRRANEFATTAAGTPIEGIRVQLSPEEARAFGAEQLDLTAPGEDQLLALARLDELLAALDAEG